MIVAAAPAAPAVPAAAITVALILLAFAWIALYGLKYGYDYSIGALLRKLADSTRGIRWIGGRIASTFESIDSWIQARIADGIDSVEASAARLWDGLAWLVRETGDALAAFGRDTYVSITNVVNGEIPAQIKGRTLPLSQAIAEANAAQNQRARAEALARTRGIDELNRDLAREQLARERGIDRINTRLQELVLPRIRALDQTVADVWGYTRRNLGTRMRNLERAAAAGVIGAIAVAAITRVFPYWQCTNVRRFNRLLCRAPIGLLDDLLGLALLVVGPVSIVGLARELQAITGAAEDGVRFFVR